MTGNHPAPSSSLIELLAEVLGRDRARRFAEGYPTRLDSLDAAASSTDTRQTQLARQEIERAHREELALLLRWACYYELAGVPDLAYTCVPPRLIETRELLARDEYDARLVDARRRCGGAPLWIGRALDLAATAWAPGRRSGVQRLAAAAERLEPAAQTGVYSAIDHIRRGRYEAAEAACRRALLVGQTAEIARLTLGWLGTAQLRRGDRRAASESWLTALQVDESCGRSALWLLELALEMEDDARAEIACERLDQTFDVSSSLRDWFVAGSASRRRGRVWAPGGPAARAARRLSSRASRGSAAAAILDACART